MPWSVCRFIKRVAEFVPQNRCGLIPDNTRGIYTLLRKSGRDRYDVVYIGMSAGDRAGMYSRLHAHRWNKRLKWTHFSIFEVHDNITRQEIRELEGLFLCIYRKDTQANKLNMQLTYRPFQRIRQNDLRKWN